MYLVQVTLLCALTLGLQSRASAQGCEEELRMLLDQRQKMRAEVMAGHAVAAAAIWAQQKVDTPAGYAYDGNLVCQNWALASANAQRSGCFLDRARSQLEEMQNRQSFAATAVAVRTALEQVSRRASLPFTCQGKDELYLICQPGSDAAPDAWCAQRVDAEMTLEIPPDAACAIVDGQGAELVRVGEQSELSCQDEGKAFRDAERRRVRAERRGSVAAAGTFFALMAVVAVPFSFVPEGVAGVLRRVHVLDKHDGEQLRHHSFRARRRVLPLLGMTSLSVSALSSRFWWAGVLTASCGITSDVMLTQYWHGGGTTRRAVGIATASVASLAGLALDIETLGYADFGERHAYMPTLRVGVAQLELGLTGSF